MKRFTYGVLLLLLACNGKPYPAPPTPETIWIDIATHSDTIITNVDDAQPVLYYAIKNWQQSSASASRGYRTIAIRFGDSILVRPLTDNSYYDGPFILKANQTNDTLTAQNFLDTSHPNTARMFMLLH